MNRKSEAGNNRTTYRTIGIHSDVLNDACFQSSPSLTGWDSFHDDHLEASHQIDVEEIDLKAVKIEIEDEQPEFSATHVAQENLVDAAREYQQQCVTVLQQHSRRREGHEPSSTLQDSSKCLKQPGYRKGYDFAAYLESSSSTFTNRKTTSSFKFLSCPKCDKTFKGGKARLPCLFKHVCQWHQREYNSLIPHICGKYNIKKNSSLGTFYGLKGSVFGPEHVHRST